MQSSLPRAERCQLPPEHYSPSPAQGANTAVGLKRKEVLFPPHTPRLPRLAPAPPAPESGGSSKSTASPRAAQRAGSEQDGSKEEREARAGNANYAETETGSTCSSPPLLNTPGPKAGERQQAAARGRRGRRSPLPPPACLGLGGTPLEDPAGGCPGEGRVWWEGAATLQQEEEEGLGCKLPA